MNPSGQPPVLPSVAPSTPPVQAPAVAEDADVIERDWIHQTEQVIAQTAGDPYAQAQQLAALKADYMQKRYAKTIKVTNE